MISPDYYGSCRLALNFKLVKLPSKIKHLISDVFEHFKESTDERTIKYIDEIYYGPTRNITNSGDITKDKQPYYESVYIGT